MFYSGMIFFFLTVEASLYSQKIVLALGVLKNLIGQGMENNNILMKIILTQQFQDIVITNLVNIL